MSRPEIEGRVLDFAAALTRMRSSGDTHPISNAGCGFRPEIPRAGPYPSRSPGSSHAFAYTRGA